MRFVGRYQADKFMTSAGLRHRGQRQSLKLSHWHRSEDHVADAPVAADIYQTDAEALVSVEE